MSNNLIRMPQPRLRKLKTLLPSLDEDQRLVIYLRFWEECSISEIAGFLKLSWDRVDQLIKSSLSYLNSELTKPEELKIAA